MHNLSALLQRKKKTLFVLVTVIVYVALFFCTYIMLQTADLGRYIVNGHEILSGNWQAILTTNYYSYVHGDYPFINHHWFFGVLVYAIHSGTGFVGLSIFGILISTLAISTMLLWSYKRYGLVAAITALLVVLPLITSRQEIRPELISMLGVVTYFVLLEKFVHSKLPPLLLWISLLFTQLFWQNTHLFFVFGLFELFVFWLYAVITKKKQAILHLGLLGITSGLLTLANPNGLQGALIPFTIFTEYGYRVAENQTVLFMYNYFGAPLYLYALVLAGTTIVVGALVLWKLPKRQLSFALLLAVLFLVFGIAAFKVNRVLSFWGIMSIPFFAMVAHAIQKSVSRKQLALFSSSFGQMIVSTLGFLTVILAASTGLFVPVSAKTGLGLAPGISDAATFILEQKLQGPIFNNYDIGGYLIYYLHPTEKVFVDNRPEAYPIHFFEDEYIAAQNSSERWHEVAKKESINLIVFYRHDLTDWAQKFMIERVADENWVPIYVDSYSLIFIRNSQENAETIEKFRIPNEVFAVSE